MYRRSGIPNEASLTAFEILELTTQQYLKKRKNSPAAGVFAGSNGHKKTKKAKPAHRPGYGPRKTARARLTKKP